MNFLRRFYLALLSIVVLVGATLLLVLPQTVNNWSANLSEQSSLLRIIIVIIIDLVLLGLLYLQVRPDPRSRATGLMMQASGAITEVSVESARDRILKAVSDVPDVVSADAEVKPIRGRADVELQVTVMGRDVQLPAKQKEINRALNQVIHKQLGLRMAGQPRVHIRFHGEETSKRPLVFAPPPAVVPEPAKLETIAPPKPEPLEPEPQKSLGVFRLRKHTDSPADEKTLPLPVLQAVEDTPPPAKAEPKAEDEDDVLSLNLEKEIASSSTDDIVIDDNETPVLAKDGEEFAIKAADVSDHQKEANLDNNQA